MVSRTPPSSAFQDLPWNLASAIIKHLGSGQNVPLTSLHMQLQLVDYSSDSEGWSVDEAESAYSYNTDGSNYRDPETGTDTLVPLLQTCRRWQILVYKYLCATCNLTLDGSGYATVGYIPSLPKAVYRNAPPVGYALINNLVLNVDYSTKFALTIASQLRVLELGNFHSAKYMVPRLQKYPNHAATLTVLKLTESIMSLDNMVELVRLLPTLTDLHCSFPGVLATDGMSLGEYLENLDSKYTPLSTVFRRLSLTVSHMVKVNGASQIALILALLCPSLCYVAVSEKMEEEFGLALRKNMSCDPFSIYACRFGILPKTSDLLHQ
ncbi:hypothetical protein EV175_000299 [Coemansia sp. RSA 1933]|nr:hypothetical protein EV175_000299 [Coemansia sp. RSA 1933]